jgi:predicted ferric reductase
MRDRSGGAPGGVSSLFRGGFWLSLYCLLLLLPILVLSSGLGPRGGSGWWFDFSMGVGFAALGIMGGQFLLTARFRRAMAPFGIDVIYVFHRWLAVVGLILIVGHYLILKTLHPGALGPAWPGAAPWHMTAGRLALAFFALLVGTSLWRKLLQLEYDHWRLVHAALATGAIVLSVVHVRGVAYYSANPWSGFLLDLFVATLLLVVVHVRIVKPLLLSGRRWTVTEVVRRTPDSWSLRLRPEAHGGIRFQPGQFGWLSLGVAPWRAKEHPFSFSGSAERSDALEFTIRELGDFTSHVGGTPEGTIAYVDGPHGSFSPDRHPRASGFIFVAGGIGIAPIMSILRTLADRSDRRPCWLVYGNRDREHALFFEELTKLEEALRLEVVHVLREPHPGWDGATGLPDARQIARVARDAPDGTHCFLCGPVPLTDMAERALHGAGIPLRRIHVELFDMA